MINAETNPKPPRQTALPRLSYVLITPARNEEVFIDKTIKSVISQSVLPRRWIIVSDGSTDRTDEIVRGYLTSHGWIRLVRRPERADRQFAAKVHAFYTGYREVESIEYAIIGNLDADITFEPDYFKFLLERFAEEPRLGVAGTPFVERGGTYDYRFTSIEHVSGACQLFRRDCFEQIGGYTPIKGGGIDWTAVTTARMKGWKTRTFPERVCYHHRSIGTAEVGALRAAFRHGMKDHFLGWHPLWEVLRSAYQMKSKPYILGGATLLLGYLWGTAKRQKRPIPQELIRYNQSEQMRRLRRILLKPLTVLGIKSSTDSSTIEPTTPLDVARQEHGRAYLD